MEKSGIKKVLTRSFLLGMSSVFFPFSLPIEPIETPQETDLENLSDDWKQVGSYIQQAYESQSF